MCDKKINKRMKKKEGDDTVSAVANKCEYTVIVKGKEKEVPAITKERLDYLKTAVDKYLKKK